MGGCLGHHFKGFFLPSSLYFYDFFLDFWALLNNSMNVGRNCDWNREIKGVQDQGRQVEGGREFA